MAIHLRIKRAGNCAGLQSTSYWRAQLLAMLVLLSAFGNIAYAKKVSPGTPGCFNKIHSVTKKKRADTTFALDRMGLTAASQPAAAYSLRLLSSSYTGPLVRLHIGDSFYDVYPDNTAERTLSLSSVVSNAHATFDAAQTGATTTPLSTVVGGGDASVAIWYDQTPNARNAVQGTMGTLPGVISGGNFLLANRKPALNFGGTQKLIISTTAFNADLSGTLVYASNGANNAAAGISNWQRMSGLLGAETPNTTTDFGYGIYYGKFAAGNGPSNNVVYSTSQLRDDRTRTTSWTRESSTGIVNLYVNQVADATQVLNKGVFSAVTSVAIGAVNNTQTFTDYRGRLSEMVLFPSVYTDAERQAIESSQASYYHISTASTINTSGTLTALRTNQDTASASTSFNVSGTDLSAAVQVFAPGNFEVSTDNINFSPNLTVGDWGTFDPVTIYIRLTATAPVGFHSGNITLNSPYAADVNVAMPQSFVRMRAADRPTLSYGPAKFFTLNDSIAPVSPVVTNVLPWGYNNQRTRFRPDILTDGIVRALTDTAGNMYIVDRFSGSIKVLPANGGPHYELGSFSYIADAIIDKEGNLYIGEEGYVYKVVPSTRTQTLLPINFNFVRIRTLAMNDNGLLYIGDGTAGLFTFDQASNTTTQVEFYQSTRYMAIFGNVLFIHDYGTFYVADADGKNRSPIGPSRDPRTSFFDNAGYLYDSYYSLSRNGKGRSAVNASTIIEVQPTFGNGSTTALGVLDGTRIGGNTSIDGKGRIYSGGSDGLITRDVPSGGYFIDRKLPSGMDFDEDSGIISGAPTVAWPKTTYTITAYNGEESVESKFTLEVGPPKATIAYTTPNTYYVASAMTPLAPTAANVTAPGYKTTKTSIATGFKTLSGMAADTAGNLYVVDRDNNKVKKVTPAGVVTEIGGSFKSPYDIGIDGKGNLYVADDGNTRIRKIPANGGPTMTIDSGSRGVNIAVDVDGNVYYSGFTANSSIYKIPAGGGARQVVATGIGTVTYSLAVDNAGNLYYGGISSGTIYKIPAGGGTPQVMATSIPTLITLKTDAAGNVYFQHLASSGPFAYVIEKLAVDGTRTMISNVAGEESFRFGLDGKGNIYTLRNYPTSAILKTEPTGGFHAGFLPAGLILNQSTGVISGTPTGASDAQNYKVYAYNTTSVDSAKINIKVKLPLPEIAYNTPNTYPAGTAITALTPTVVNTINAPGYNTTRTTIATGFNYLSGMASDTAGNLYVTDRGANRVKKITPNGTVTEIGGTFQSPTDIVRDLKGNLYIAEEGARRVRKIPYNGGPTVTIDSAVSAYNLAVDAKGDLYHNSNQSFGRLYKIPANGGQRVEAGPGNLGISYALAIDYAGNIYRGSVGGTLYKYPADGSSAQVILSGLPTLISVKTDAEGNLYMIHLAESGPFGYVIDKYTVATGTRAVINRVDGEESFRMGLDEKGNVYTLQTNKTKGIYKTTPNGGFHAGLLPAGLTLNQTTGTISGTPSSGSLAADYKITGYNSFGTSSALVNIAVQSSNATLASLKPSTGTLSPAFNSDSASYTINVTGETPTIALTPIVSEASAAVTVNGMQVASGKPSSGIPLNIGDNVISTVVTASDNSTTKTYNVTVKRPATANLSSLTINLGTLDKPFNRDSLTYRVVLPNATAQLEIIPTAFDPGATIVAGEGAYTLQSGQAAYKPLRTYNNVFAMVVTASDGATKTYTLNIYVQPSVNAGLTNLLGTQGLTLSPAFDPAQRTYSGTVGFDKTYFTVVATAAVQSTTIKYNNLFTRYSGGESGEMDLNVGLNTIPVVTTAEDGTTQENYTLLITREGAANVNLSGIQATNVTFNEAFDPTVLNYTATADNGLLQTNFVPAAADANATIKVNGVATTDPAYTGIYDLVVGPNVFMVLVTGQNGVATRTYTVTVNRGKSDNNYLRSLIASGGEHYPFEGQQEYNISVAHDLASIKLTPTVRDTTATIKVNGAAVASGAESAAINLSGSTTTISVAVTAQDSTVRVYNVIVNRQADASLTALTLSSGTLSPVFISGTVAYTASVANATTAITLTPIPVDPASTVTVNGASPATPVSLVGGDNIIPVVVTASDGATKTYTVTVNREKSANILLNTFKLSPSSSLKAISNTTARATYSMSVAASTTEVTFSAVTADPNASMAINGAAATSGVASAPIQLTGASTLISVVVTAENGTTTKTYEIAVNKTGSANANLSKLILSSGTLSPGFSANTVTYTAAVGNATTSITLTPIVGESSATVKVNGVAVASGTASAPVNLLSGANTIVTQVTSGSGATKTYTLTATRAKSDNVTLNTFKLSPPSSLVNLTNTATYATYSMSVAAATPTAKFSAITQDENATMTINGLPATSGVMSADIALTGYSTTITVVVTAENGITTKTYEISVIKAGSVNANLSKLVLSAGTLSPTFSANTIAYTASVDNATTSVTLTPTVAESFATVKVNGAAVPSGFASGALNLNVGNNTITATITAGSGRVKTYTIVVNRQGLALTAATKGTKTDQSVSLLREDKPKVSEEIVPVTVHQAVSPNGDGINDHLTIDGITTYPENTVKVMNRNGEVIFQSKGYNNQSNTFDGHGSNGKLQQAGTYFYSLEYKNGAETKYKTGYLVIKY